MKKILSILICVVLGISGVHAADLTINAKAYVYASTGGQVAASQSTTTPTSGWGTSATGQFTKEHDRHKSYVVYWTYYWDGYNVYYHAQANSGYTFIGWSNDNNNSVDNNQNSCMNDVSTTQTISKAYGGTSTDAATRYAIFRSIVEFPYGKDIVLYTDPVTGTMEPAELSITINKASALDISSTDPAFTILEPQTLPISLNGGTDQYVTIKVTATPGTEEGFYEDVIKLVPSNSSLTEQEFNAEEIYLDIEIKPSPVITFNPADANHGSYTYQQTNIQPTPDPVAVSSVKQIGLLTQSQGVVKLVATPKTGYRFNKWIIEEEGQTKEFFDAKIVYNFTKESNVSAEFIATKYAQFFVKDNPSVKYNDLNLAVKAAEASSTKVIVVDPSYVVNGINGGYLKAGTYTIPDGYTLLVPADDAYTTLGHAQNCTSNEWAADDVTLPTKCYSKLIIEDGTTLNVDGVLCVYAKWNYANSTTTHMKPGNYGWIEMEGNSVININDATLHALGYITNSKSVDITKDNMNQVGRVVANSNAIIYEILVMSDWRGGSALVGSTSKAGQLVNLGIIYGGGAAGMVKNPSKVFPMNQYYFQNVEVPLTMNPGSKEKVQMTVDAGVLAMATVDFIVPNDAANADESQIASGLLRLGDNTKLTKYYDKNNDRLCLYLDEYTEGGAHTLPTFFHTIVMNLAVGTSAIPVSSEQYTLPITNNIDIVIGKNLQVDIVSGRDLAFLPGASMKVDANSTVNVNSNVYIYDTDERVFHDVTRNTAVNGKGYFSAGNGTLYKLPYRPDGVPAVRTTSNIADSKWDINGNVYVNGALYTTEGGANITSSLGGGSVYFNTIGTNDTTAQGFQSGTVSFYHIPITNAKLHNANGTYSAGNYVTSGQRYLYYNGIEGGKWSLPIAGIPGNPTLPELKISLPTVKDVSGKIVCQLTKPDGVRDFIASDFSVVPDNANFVIGTLRVDGDKLYIPITYKSQDKHGEYTANLTINNSTTAVVELEKTFSITAAENYVPDFTVSEIIPFASTTVKNPLPPQGLAISLVEGNVTTIWNDATYGERMSWEFDIIGANAQDFEFAWGEGDKKLSEAVITFNPQSVGNNKTATLVLTATYTDGAAQKKEKQIEISLAGSASLNENLLQIADFPREIYDDAEAFALLTGTNNAGTPISITPNPSDVVDVEGEGLEAKIKPRTVSQNRVVDITISQAATSEVEAFNATVPLQIKSRTAALFPLDLCVDSRDEFDMHTTKLQQVAFDNATIFFNSTETTNAVWAMQFKGVPNQVNFTLAGESSWLVEQSEEGDIWTALPATKAGVYSLALSPKTRHLRFTYARGTSQGQLAELCVHALKINADASKKYLPINVNGDPSSQVFTLNHANDLTVNDIAELAIITTTTNLGTAEEPYFTTTIVVSPNANTALETEYTLHIEDTKGNAKDLLIRTYRNPQLLPINLGTDDTERFYFVRDEAHSNYVDWDASNKEVIFQNPNTASSQTRYLTFFFEGAPHHISFEVENLKVEDWEILESTDGSIWNTVRIEPLVDGNKLWQELDYRSNFVRLQNVSLDQSEVRVENLVITGKSEMSANPDQLVFDKENKILALTLTAVNLNSVRIEIDNPSQFSMIQGVPTEESEYVDELLFNKDTYNGLGYNKYCDIPLTVKWSAKNMVDVGNVVIYDAEVDTIVAVVPLLGADQYLVKENADKSGIFTGIPEGYTFHGSPYTEYQHHEINLINAFEKDGDKALFDYLFIYGETTPSSGTNITAPGTNGELVGSNAVTPYYVYKKSDDGLGYLFAGMVDNANTTDKSQILGITSQDENTTVYIDVQDSLSVYMTGFCPYATTGCTTDQEGVWFFRGEHGETLNIYLEDCHIFSRNKTVNGNAFYGEKEGGETYDDDYTKGSGGVLVFENTDSSESLELATPFQVRIHTLNDNLLKSNHGCFFLFMNSMKAYQVSAPIHVHMHSEDHIRTSKTTLDFDDHWPTSLNEEGNIASTERTNGYLALMKQTNNAPSIDLGNPNTVVNFRGGRIKLQNAQIVSTNYKTTLAISYRSGEFGAVGEGGKGLKLSYGIGTDSIGGTVKFYDGTIMVEPMLVKEEYKQYYLIDKDETGNEIKEYRGTDKYGQPIYAYQTSCLRCPKNTYVRGGSICPIRACQHVTSKGGAPKDSPTGASLGLYVYTLSGDDEVAENGLATKIQFPLNVTNPNLKDYYDSKSYTYGVNSVDPDVANKLYFWIPDGYGNVEAEKDKFLSVWKACMTSITAGLGEKGGSIGGDTPIESNEEVKYFLYCQLDESTYQVISETEEDENGNERLKYEAPMGVPPVAQDYFGGDEYTRIRPAAVGDELQHQVMSDSAYTITDKVYYVTTATADVWQTFTAPFDVAKIWVVESYDENILKKTPKDEENGLTKRQSVMLEQAKHNADFAAFFAVAMALGTYDDFEGIYSKYIKWAEEFEKRTPDTQGKAALIPYLGDNWKTAHFYLNHNKDDWKLDAEADTFEVQWDMLTQADLDDGILLHQGETYSMLFPYCTGCWEYDGEGENASVIEREFWDYWSGKFLIFESTNGNVKGPHIIQGSNYIAESKIEEQPWIFDVPEGEQLSDDATKVTGNSTFAFMSSSRENIYTYVADPSMESFVQYYPDEGYAAEIYPTTSFLYGNIPTNIYGMPAKKVTREGKIIYGASGNENDGTTTGSHTPTIGGGNDMFITAVDGGINIAVAAPQTVCVVNAIGHVLYNGYVTNNVNVHLSVNGIYVVKGENEVQKIFF